jgi:hypothetical protein
MRTRADGLARSQGSWRRGRRFVPFVMLLAVLVMVSIGIGQTAGAAPVGRAGLTLAPTLKVGPSTNLVGNRVVHIAGKHWPANDDSMQVELCSSEVSPSSASCGYIGYPVPSTNGSWSFAYAPLNPQAPVDCQEAPVCYIEATDNSTTLTAQVTFKPLTVFLTPDEYGDGYYWTQKVAVHVTGFPSDDPITVELCTWDGDCDPDSSVTIAVNGGGNGSAHDYYLNESICSDYGDCAMIATDPAYPQGVEADYDFEGYCGPVCGGFGPDSKPTAKVK